MKKTILITGSTDGIGKLAAEKLAHEGHHLYLHGRNAEKLARVIAEMKVKCGNGHIDGFVADLSSFESVKKMTDEVLEKLPKLDVLINNAGIYKSANARNADGLDLRFVVNYLAPYYQTNAWLPLLEKGANARIINLSSAAQKSVDLAVLKGEKQDTEQATYAQSKLALTMWSYELAKTLNYITVIPLNPGSLLNTNMVKEAFGHHWSSAEKGAQIIYQLAVSEQYAGITGKYFDNDHGAFGRPHADVYDEGKIQELIKATDLLLTKFV